MIILLLSFWAWAGAPRILYFWKVSKLFTLKLRTTELGLVSADPETFGCLLSSSAPDASGFCVCWPSAVALAV